MSGRPSTTTACPKCGGSLFAGDRFCGSCGASLYPGLADAPTQAADDTPRPEGFTSYDGWERIVQRLRAATVGEFEIRRELGRGGMAIVFLAHDIALRRKVAVKLMSPGLLTNEDMVRKFREEAVMVAHMSHPNIITIHAVRDVDDLHFFIMKFVEGQSLDQVIRSVGPLPIPLARSLLHQVGSALAYAHRRGVIHRDVKPANILIDVESEAIVTDFGIAKAVDSETHTKTGSVIGTPAYMSPEQCYALPATAASDQYSLGVVAYEMIAGRAPFIGPSFVVMKAHADEPVPPLRDKREDCPPELDAAVMRMLAKKPEDRFPTIGQALTALGTALLPEDDPHRLELSAAVRKNVPAEPSLTPVSPIPVFTNERPVPSPAARVTPTGEKTVPIPPAKPDVQKGAVPVVPTVPAPEPKSIAAAAATQPIAPAVSQPAEVPAAPVPVSPTPGSSRGLWAGIGVAAVAAIAWVVLRNGPAPNVAPAAPVAADTAAAVVPVQPTPRPRVDSGTLVPPAATTPVPEPPPAVIAPTPVPAPAADVPVARAITLVPAELTLVVGQTMRAGATVRDANRKPIAGSRVVWMSPNGAVATVNRTTGEVTAVGPGTTEIGVSSGDARGVLRVRVEAPVVLATLAVEQPRRLTVGDNVTLTASARDSRGNLMPGQSVSWQSSDPGIATVGSSSGIVTAARAGTADITASSAGVSTSVRLTVTAPAPPPEPRIETPRPPAVDPAAEERRSVAAIETAVQDYVQALRSHDARRVTASYHAESDADRKTQQQLVRLMEGAAKLTAGTPTVVTPRIEGNAATVDFSVPMTWRNPFGILRNQTVTFRAAMERDGGEWRMASSRVVGSLSP